MGDRRGALAPQLAGLFAVMLTRRQNMSNNTAFGAASRIAVSRL